MTRSPIGLALVASVAMVALVACGSSDSSSTATTATTTASTSTTATPSTTAAPAATQPAEAVWPSAAGSVRFADPVEAARSFAVDYLGFTSPVLGPLQSGDGRSGEVAVQPRADGPVTTVLVRRLAPDDTWWVLGASTPNLQLTSPAALATITSPVTLAGQSTAFEATVDVQIRQDGTPDALAKDFVMGGSMGEMGPFSKAVPFTPPSAAAGAVVLETFSAEDGTVREATVTRIAFG
jgi:hypothetical protein